MTTAPRRWGMSPFDLTLALPPVSCSMLGRGADRTELGSLPTFHEESSDAFGLVLIRLGHGSITFLSRHEFVRCVGLSLDGSGPAGVV